ncbi:MAG: hypothetical protein OHK0029_11790 [Armatimonadaceae bacterium]
MIVEGNQIITKPENTKWEIPLDTEVSVPRVKGARRRAKDDRADAILAAAHQLMAEKGYQAMTMDDLAAQAGITKPTLYRYFASKEAIAVAATARLMQRGRQFQEELDPSLPVLERIEKSLDWVLHQRYVTHQAAFGAARESLSPYILSHPTYQHEYELTVNAFAELIEEGKEAGVIPPFLVTRVAVQMVFSVMRDGEFEILSQSGNWDPAEIKRTLLHMLFCGLCTLELPGTVAKSAA